MNDDIFWGGYVFTPTGGVTHDGQPLYYGISPNLFDVPMSQDCVFVDGAPVYYTPPDDDELEKRL